MITRQQIRHAALLSIVLHVLLVCGVTTILAYRRSMPPVNDDFREATKISSQNYFYTSINTKYFSRENNEPIHSGRAEGGSVWWKWTPEVSCDVLLEVESSGFESVCGVYQGAVLETLVKVGGSTDDNESIVSFSAEIGKTYHFVVASTLPSVSGFTELKMSVSSEEEELVILVPEMFSIEKPKEVEKEFLRTDSNKPSQQIPDNAVFESDRNTIAASDLNPSDAGDENTPNISGEALSFGELSRKEYSDGEFKDDMNFPIIPQLIQSSSLKKKTSIDPLDSDHESEVLRHDEPHDIASFEESLEEEDSIEGAEESVVEKPSEITKKVSDEKSTNQDFIQDTVSEKLDPIENFPPEPAFQVHSPKKKNLGKLSNLGKAAMNVEETNFGHYKKKVDLAIQKSWHRERSAHADLVKYGSLKVRFWVDRDGRIVDIRMLRNDADPVVVDFSISGILRAEIPPVPNELIEKTQDGKMEFEYEIIIY